MITLIKNIEVYSPAYLGVKDVLIENSVIGAMEAEIRLDCNFPINVIDGSGKILLPGFVDPHVHILGGGGEGSFRTRTPEIVLSSIIAAGVTTLVGCLGTDGFTRSMGNLIAKAKGLREEGVSCYVLTGSYDVPVRTLMDSIKDDIIFIEEVIGVGEVAISDHRSSQPTKEDIAKILGEARVAGLLSGKRGVVQFHLGESDEKLDMLNEIADTTTIPIYHMMPTHCNRNRRLFADAIIFAKKGGNVDFTISPDPATMLEEDEVKCSVGLREMLEAGVPIERITFSSDGQGSFPLFDKAQKLIGMGVGTMEYLYKEVVDATLEEKIPLEQAIKVITSNPAQNLGLGGKGEIRQGFDADLCIVDKVTYELETVIAMGRVMMENKRVVVKGTFEK